MTQSLNKFQIPVRTKIAVWWVRVIVMFIVVAIAIIFFAGGFRSPCPTVCDQTCDNSGCREVCFPSSCSVSVLANLLPPLLTILFLIFLPAFLLSFGILKNKKWAWGCILAILLIPGVPLFLLFLLGFFYNLSHIGGVICGLALVFVSLLFLVPSILFLLDRKNYFAAAEREEKQIK